MVERVREARAEYPNSTKLQYYHYETLFLDRAVPKPKVIARIVIR